VNDENSPADAGRDAGQAAVEASPSPLLPPVLGMVGGGYRSRLTAQAAINLGIRFRLLADAADDYAAQVAPSLGSVVGDYRSADELLAFTAGCEILTFEREDVPGELLAKVEPMVPQVAVRPGLATLRLVRDKAALEDWLTSLGLAVADLAGSAVAAVYRELAVVVARSPEGQGVAYPVTMMLRSDGLRREFIAPAPDLDPDIGLEAQRIALKIAAELSLTGLLTIDLAESGGKLSVIDLAVTPHDSGLWTMDAAVTSQFEQYLRAVLDLPFGTPTAVAANAVTVTVLGGDDPDVFTRFVHVMAADPGARVHIYTNQVSQIRSGCRVGHVTVAGPDLERVRDRAWRAANYLGLGTEGA
jgi:5-(carboxyamino)imidazole ribonucleotide synthase